MHVCEKGTDSFVGRVWKVQHLTVIGSTINCGLMAALLEMGNPSVFFNVSIQLINQSDFCIPV